MILPSRQRGVALFTAVFLLVVVAVLALSVSLIAGQQHIATVQSLEQTQAYYAARARLGREIAELLTAGEACDATPETVANDIAGFTTHLRSCVAVTVDEGGRTYTIYTLAVEATRGERAAATLVQRTVRAQVTAGP